MKTEFWLEKWEKNEIGFHQQGVNAYLQAYWQNLKLKPDGKVLVPLCGKSRDMLWLRGQGHPVLGVELSPIAVRDFFAENAITPHISQQGPFQRWEADGLAILQGDFFNLTASDVEDVEGVFDRAALIALPQESRQRYSQHLQGILPDMAGMLLVVLEYEQAMKNGPPFSVSAEEIRWLYPQNRQIIFLDGQDVLDGHPHLRAGGLNALQENVYLISPFGDSPL